MARVFSTMRLDGLLSAERTKELTTALGDRPVEGIASLPVYELAEAINDALPTLGAHLLGEESSIVRLAGQILDFMRKTEFVGAPAPATAAAPQVVEVKLPPIRATMSLAQLLDELVRNPGDRELHELICATPQVRRAERKLGGAATWVITNPDGSLNVAETTAYVAHLATNGTLPQPKWRQHYVPTTLALVPALGFNQRAMLYPSLGDGGLGLMAAVGNDQFGLSWASLPDEVHEAFVWGIAMRHRNLVGTTNVRQLTDDMLGNELPAYLREIVEEYRLAKARNLPTTIGVSRYAPTDIPLGGGSHPFAAEPVRDETWYRQWLEERAEHTISYSGMSVRVRGVCLHLEVNGMRHYFDSPIVLVNGSVLGMSHGGIIYKARDARVHISGMGSTVQVISRTYKELAQMAGAE